MPTTAPVSTSQDSPQTLKLRGYTVDELANYIIRKLGGPVWNVELTRQQILDNIQDALAYFSLYQPRLLFGTIQMQQGKKN